MLPKWRPRYMGFMQLDHLIAGYRAMWHRLTQFEGVKAIPSLLVIVTQCLDKLQHNISIFGLVMVETWPLYIWITATSIFHPKSQNLPAADLLLAVSPKACCIFIGATPHSLAQIAALHPNIWLSPAAKMAPQVYGFYAARPPIAGYRAMWHGFNLVCRSQSYFLFIGVIHLASGPNWSIKAQCLS